MCIYCWARFKKTGQRPSQGFPGSHTSVADDDLEDDRLKDDSSVDEVSMFGKAPVSSVGCEGYVMIACFPEGSYVNLDKTFWTKACWTLSRWVYSVRVIH